MSEESEEKSAGTDDSSSGETEQTRRADVPAPIKMLEAQLVNSAPPVAQVGIMLNLPPDAAASLAREVPGEMVKLVSKFDDHQYENAKQRNEIHLQLSQTKAEYEHLQEMKDLDNDLAAEKLGFEDRERQRLHLRLVGLGAVGVLVIGLVFVAFTGNDKLLLDLFDKVLLPGLAVLAGVGLTKILGEKKD